MARGRQEFCGKCGEPMAEDDMSLKGGICLSCRFPGQDAFIPLPGFPGYTISPLGRVRSERSRSYLTHDVQGRVTLAVSGKRRKYFLGELLGPIRDATAENERLRAELEAERARKGPETVAGGDERGFNWFDANTYPFHP